MKVFSQLYVTLQYQAVYNNVAKTSALVTDLGFATPVENENAADLKRRKTANNWAMGSQPQVKGGALILNHLGGYTCGSTRELRSKIIDNTPREGFKITDSVKRQYWGGGNVVFRVEDPAGFELEIQSQNLMMLLLSTVVENGVIKGKCVWGRDGATNVLLHETSNEYQDAFKKAESLKPIKKASINGWKAGDVVKLTNGEVGTYLGRYYGYSFQNDYVKDPLYTKPQGHYWNGNLDSQGYHIATLVSPVFADHIAKMYQRVGEITSPVRYYFFKCGDAITAYRELKVAEIVQHSEVEITFSECQKNVQSVFARTTKGYDRIELIREAAVDLYLQEAPMTEEGLNRLIEFFAQAHKKEPATNMGFNTPSSAHKVYSHADIGLSTSFPQFFIEHGGKLYDTFALGHSKTDPPSYMGSRGIVVNDSAIASECKFVDGKIHFVTRADSRFQATSNERVSTISLGVVKTLEDITLTLQKLYQQNALRTIVVAGDE
jgi:hypothetical protein